MGIPVFLVILCFIALLIAIFSNNASSKDRKKIKDFLDNQSKVYIVPHEKLNQIDFIKVDLSKISFKAKKQNTKLAIKELIALSKARLANFEGMTNDDLKKEYGTNNFDEVLEYQNNYDNLLKSLISISEDLIIEGDDKGAIILLNTAMSLGCDVTKNYTLLADLYEKHSMKKELFELIDIVKSNKKISQKKIMNYISNMQNAKQKGEI